MIEEESEYAFWWLVMTWDESFLRRAATTEEMILKRISRRQMGRRLEGSVGFLFGLGIKITFLLLRLGDRRPLEAAELANLRRRGLMTG